MDDRFAYLDHNASSRLRPVARAALIDALDAPPGNPSSIHRFGVLARARLDEARQRIADALKVNPEGLVFTSSGTESNHGAILGLARNSLRRVVVTSPIEHPSVLRACEQLKSEGFEIRFLPLDAAGFVDLARAESVVDSTVALVTIQGANHEVGVIQPVAALAKLAARHGALSHTDSAQVVGRTPQQLGVDSITLASHKLGGPKGIAAVWFREPDRARPWLLGGAQESGRRAGTPAPELAWAFALAFEESTRTLPSAIEMYTGLKDRLISGLDQRGLQYLPLTPATGALPNTFNVAFPGVDRVALAIQLDLQGIAVGTGSACASGSSELSPVLLALGVPREIAASSVRVSFGWPSTTHDVDRLLESLPRALDLAKLSSRASL